MRISKSSLVVALTFILSLFLVPGANAEEFPFPFRDIRSFEYSIWKPIELKAEVDGDGYVVAFWLTYPDVDGVIRLDKHDLSTVTYTVDQVPQNLITLDPNQPLEFFVMGERNFPVEHGKHTEANEGDLVQMQIGSEGINFHNSTMPVPEFLPTNLFHCNMYTTYEDNLTCYGEGLKDPRSWDERRVLIDAKDNGAVIEIYTATVAEMQIIGVETNMYAVDINLDLGQIKYTANDVRDPEVYTNYFGETYTRLFFDLAGRENALITFNEDFTDTHVQFSPQVWQGDSWAPLAWLSFNENCETVFPCFDEVLDRRGYIGLMGKDLPTPYPADYTLKVNGTEFTWPEGHYIETSRKQFQKLDSGDDALVYVQMGIHVHTHPVTEMMAYPPEPMANR